MPVFQIHCPRCQGRFIDSRPEWKDGDVAQCPKCGTEIAAHPVDVAATDRHVTHAEPAPAEPLDE